MFVDFDLDPEAIMLLPESIVKLKDKICDKTHSRYPIMAACLPLGRGPHGFGRSTR